MFARTFRFTENELMMNSSAGDNPLRDRRAIISGAAGDMGQLCARELAGQGARLTLVDIDSVTVNRLADELGAKAHCFDVLCESSVRQFMRSLRSHEWGGGLLVNAAGAGYVRTLGMMRVTSAFSKAVQGSGATIMNIASAGRHRDPYRYAGSDLAFHQLSHELVTALKRPDFQVLTFGIGDQPPQIVDALRQWHRVGSEAQDGNRKQAREA